MSKSDERRARSKASTSSTTSLNGLLTPRLDLGLTSDRPRSRSRSRSRWVSALPIPATVNMLGKGRLPRAARDLALIFSASIILSLITPAASMPQPGSKSQEAAFLTFNNPSGSSGESGTVYRNARSPSRDFMVDAGLLEAVLSHLWGGRGRNVGSGSPAAGSRMQRRSQGYGRINGFHESGFAVSHDPRISKKELNRNPRYDDSLLTGETSLPSAFRLRKRSRRDADLASFFDEALSGSFSDAVPHHETFVFTKRSAAAPNPNSGSSKPRRARSDAFRLKRNGNTSFRLRKKRDSEEVEETVEKEEEKDEDARFKRDFNTSYRLKRDRTNAYRLKRSPAAKAVENVKISSGYRL